MDSVISYEMKHRLNNELLYEQINGSLKLMESKLLKMCGPLDTSLGSECKRILLSKGKRLRPSLAYLCYKMSGNNTHAILPLMCMLEIMHTASLIHDDVIDDAKERRGEKTIHSLHGNLMAVQCGDYLLAKAMEQLHHYKGTGINEVMADISYQMCMGEIQQIRNLFRMNEQTKENYFLQVKRKTAFLMGGSCYTGALAGGMDPLEADILRQFGIEIGMAFQLKDDILDIKGGKSFGKPLGQDLKRGIFTLPLILALESKPNEEITLLAEKTEKTQLDIKKIVHYISEFGGVEKTQQIIWECSTKALFLLNGLQDCAEREALAELVRSLATRKI